MPSILVAGSMAALADSVAAELVAAGARAIAERGRFTLALPGGSVATTCLPRLVSSALDWSRTHVFFGDERAVPPDHPDSNYGLARTLLLSRVPLPADRVHRMPARPEALAEAARACERTLVEVLGDPPRLDLALLGVGEDGHVCSLFPGHPALQTTGWVAAVRDAPKPPADRLTLTLPALAAARQVVVVAMGARKAPVIREAIEEAESTLPVARVARESSDAWFILDADAASQLGQPSSR